MTDRRDIGSRLENWARLHRQESSPIMEKGERRAFDLADAQLLDLAMRDLPTGARSLLWWCYVKQVTPDAACRKLGIARRPMADFVRVFRAAQDGIEDQVSARIVGPEITSATAA